MSSILSDHESFLVIKEPTRQKYIKTWKDFKVFVHFTIGHVCNLYIFSLGWKTAPSWRLALRLKKRFVLVLKKSNIQFPIFILQVPQDVATILETWQAFLVYLPQPSTNLGLLCCWSGCVQYSTVHTVQYSTVQYSTVQYSTVQYSTVQYSTVQYSTVQYNCRCLSSAATESLWMEVSHHGDGVCDEKQGCSERRCCHAVKGGHSSGETFYWPIYRWHYWRSSFWLSSSSFQHSSLHLAAPCSTSQSFLHLWRTVWRYPLDFSDSITVWFVRFQFFWLNKRILEF